MKKTKLMKIVSDPKMISGIHNYCDKWCERCRFKTRCAVGIMDLEDKKQDSKELDLNSPEFWDKLHGIFADTFEMIGEMARKNGVDVDAPIPEEYWIQKEKRDKNAREHVCAKASWKYMEMVRKWMDGSSKDFEKKADELMKNISMGLPNKNPEKDALEIKDAVDVIIWNHTLIHVKLMRAVQQIFEDEPEILEDLPKDYDGSAKIALISIDNSIKVWETLLSHFPEKEDEILKMLSLLQKLGRRTELEFPNARSFKRPGFDE
ncbi:MAG TPA: hypothetical protein DCZ94_10850 [Lentisphaeria bacterium]|nr:MAG: hypothetical protein A2X48_06730 [Lentisphaerae bacterium GWF2_49_21]HBC87443.1 hypothetical protein [Lentisphaeria bacterium]